MIRRKKAKIFLKKEEKRKGKETEKEKRRKSKGRECMVKTLYLVTCGGHEKGQTPGLSGRREPSCWPRSLARPFLSHTRALEQP